ncbi:hypothetical protein OG21DRAFT_1521345 [Imleria badia]|nr:hypothetical protein OG21DRAFT_1521345 [Imleria badia]
MCSKATVTVDENEDRSFPNDLTIWVVREDHGPVASGGFADIYRGIFQSNALPIQMCLLKWIQGFPKSQLEKWLRAPRIVLKAAKAPWAFPSEALSWLPEIHPTASNKFLLAQTDCSTLNGFMAFKLTQMDHTLVHPWEPATSYAFSLSVKNKSDLNAPILSGKSGVQVGFKKTSGLVPLVQRCRLDLKECRKTIKTYSGEDGDFAKKKKQLRREIKVWLGLKHDNVLPLLGTTKGFGQFPAMVCPWAKNGTLTSYLKECHDGLPVVEILHLDLIPVRSAGQRCFWVHKIFTTVDLRWSSWQYIHVRLCTVTIRQLGGSTFATSFHERGTIRWMAPELLDLRVPENELEEEASHVLPTTHSDVYSFGGVMLQTLSGKVPYHYYAREMQVVHAVSRGITPTRPSGALVTERRWAFIQRCWSTVDIVRTRPSSEEIVDFTKTELAGISAS